MRKLVRLTAHMCVRLLEGTAAMKLARPIVAAVTLFWLLPIRAAPATAPMPKAKDGCPPQYQTMGELLFPPQIHDRGSDQLHDVDRCDGHDPDDMP
jgi:hypothetical protein